MNFFKILLFIIGTQLKQLFVVRNILSVVGKIFFVCLVIFYAVACGYILNNALVLQVKPDSFLAGINTAIAALTFMKNYFPAYQPTSQPIASYYPMRRKSKAVMGILLDLLSIFPIGIVFFYCIMFVVGFSALSIGQIFQSLMFFITALLFDRSLRLLIEYSVPYRIVGGIGLVFCSVFLFFSSGINLFEWLHPVIVQIILFIVSIISQIFLALQTVLPQTNKNSTASRYTYKSTSKTQSVLVYTLKSFYTSNHILKLFAMALLLKIVMLIFLLKVDNQGISEINSLMHINMVWLYAMPVAWFTYVLNNSFGVKWQLWQTRYLHSSSRYDSLILYSQYAILPVILDAILSGFVLWFRGFLDNNVVIFWVWCTLSLFAFGFIVSTIIPIKVEKLSSSAFLTLRQVSSVAGRFGVVMILIAIFLLIMIHFLFGSLIPLIAVAGVSYYLSNYKIIKYRIYNGIHK